MLLQGKLVAGQCSGAHPLPVCQARFGRIPQLPGHSRGLLGVRCEAASTSPAPSTPQPHQPMHAAQLSGSSLDQVSIDFLENNVVPARLEKRQGLLLSDISLSSARAPLLLGLLNYLEHRVPSVGFFEPVAYSTTGTVPHVAGPTVDRHVELVSKTFDWKDDSAAMSGVSVPEAAKLLSTSKLSELLDRAYTAFITYKAKKDFVVVEGPGPIMGGTELDAQLAAALNVPVLMTIAGKPNMTANDYFNLAVSKRQIFADHRVPVTGVAMNLVPQAGYEELIADLKERFSKVGLPFVGGLPRDPLLAAVRLDEVKAHLSAEVMWGDEQLLDQEYDSVIVASQRLEELLEMLETSPAQRPLIITSLDRLDLVLGLLAAQLSVTGPTVAGVLLTSASSARGAARSYARNTVDSIFAGLAHGGLYRGTLMPVMVAEQPMYDVLQNLSRMSPAILPTSTKKISQCKLLFDTHIDTQMFDRALISAKTPKFTPKMFVHSIKSKCLANPQHIVLPEPTDPRVLAAASEVTIRGLAKITLLGDPVIVYAEAKKLGLDISLCNVIDPVASPDLKKYVDLLVKLRKGKGMTPESALDALEHDVNYYGTMMVAAGDADGMVSGAIHTTASTIRPGLQVLKAPGVNGKAGLVSSIFFMCMPDKVLVYGDCAVNINPTAEQLAEIAIVSADTATAFGIQPRVAMLSYSTLGSGAGPEVEKVITATALVKQMRPDIKVEGPIQYDAAIDPTVAAVKVKSGSKVAGRATVFVFPDLNTGNNTYKAVQQATGALAIGPVIQGLLKPVNDLSRGCTVADIVTTICVTSVSAVAMRQQVEDKSREGQQDAIAPAPAAAKAAQATAAPPPPPLMTELPAVPPPLSAMPPVPPPAVPTA